MWTRLETEIKKNVNGIFFRHSRVANSVDSRQIWPNFELILDTMHVLVTCKFKKDMLNISREKVETSIFETLKGI